MKMAQVVWLLVIPGSLWGQTQALSDVNPVGTLQRGVHLQGVSITSGYFMSGAPIGFEIPTQSPFLQSPTISGGITATFGGAQTEEKSSFTWSYSPSYFYMARSASNYSNSGSLSHRLGVSWNRKMGRSWSVSASLNGFIANMEQLYFTPSLLSSIASMPMTFDDLAAGMLAGRFTDAQLAALLTGAPLQASPQQGYPYGNRLMNVAANVGLSWTPSERTSVSVSFTGNRMQRLNGAGAVGSTSSSSAGFLPQATTGGVALSWSYSLSPRTQFSATAMASRSFSQLQQGYGTTTSVSLGRTMSRRWLVQGRGGAGKLIYLKQLYTAPQPVQFVFGGNIAFKTAAHTFMVSYDRSLGDGYGLGSASTSTAMGAWSWRLPGNGWALSANGGFQQLSNATFQNTRSWRAGVGVSRAWGAHFSSSFQYVYFQLPVNISVNGQDQTENGLSASLMWSPSRGR